METQTHNSVEEQEDEIIWGLKIDISRAIALILVIIAAVLYWGYGILPTTFELLIILFINSGRTKCRVVYKKNSGIAIKL